MNNTKPILTALISVYCKDGLNQILKELDELNIAFISTGGTYEFITSLGYNCSKVEDLTNFPELFDGRVKTLHPTIMGGILHRRDNLKDINDAQKFSIPSIDLVIVDLYPFEQTIKECTNEQEIIEKIDIGGISLIRAAAKNFNDVFVVSSVEQYSDFLKIIQTNTGFTSLCERKLYAQKAFAVTSHYDTIIYNYFNRELLSEDLRITSSEITHLRYGENPHQKAVYYGNLYDVFDQLHGKEISYNNLQDLDSALKLVNEFEKPVFVIVKHTNPCGVGEDKLAHRAFKVALSSDPVSAFGGVIVTNSIVDIDTAKELNEIFFELLCAKEITSSAYELLKSKKNRILLELKNFKFSNRILKSCLNGFISQDRDEIVSLPSSWNQVTTRKFPIEKLETAIFANKIVKHTTSNAIVLASDNKLIGSGMGQTSRVDSVKLAISKALNFGHDLNNSVLASDAFFPFTDGIEYAKNYGIEYFIQPGGSIRDKEIIEYCNKHNIAMIFTGIRHFKH